MILFFILALLGILTMFFRGRAHVELLFEAELDLLGKRVKEVVPDTSLVDIPREVIKASRPYCHIGATLPWTSLRRVEIRKDNGEKAYLWYLLDYWPLSSTRIHLLKLEHFMGGA